MSTITVAIAGFTGKFARCVTTHLLTHPQVQIKGFCRNPSKLPDFMSNNPRVTVIKGDSSDLAACRDAVRHADVIICSYLGDDNLMIEGQKTLIDASIAEKVPRYIASDYALDFRNIELGDIDSKDAMKKVQAYLKSKKEIEGVHVLIGCFMQTFWSFVGGYDAASNAFKYWGTGDEKWELTTYDNAAEYVAEVAMDKTATGFLKFVGDSLSTKEIASVFTSTYHTTPTLHNLGTLPELYTAMKTAKKNNPSNLYAYLNQQYQYYILNGQTLLGDSDNDRYPHVKPVGVKDFLADTELATLSKSAYF